MVDRRADVGSPLEEGGAVVVCDNGNDIDGSIRLATRTRKRPGRPLRSRDPVDRERAEERHRQAVSRGKRSTRNVRGVGNIAGDP
jgi:hypothetical protein